MDEADRHRQMMLNRYAEGPDRLEKSLSGLTEIEMDLNPLEGGWTIRQIANHIVDGDDLWKLGLKAALGNPDGVFTLDWYWENPQEEWANQWAYTSRDTNLALALLRANRAHIEDLIQKIPDAWERAIHIRWPHEVEGQISVGDIVAMQAEHLMLHVEDIQRILQAHGRLR